MTFESTHQEYCWLRAQLGYEGDGILKHVWEGCEPASQENMLEQLRKPLRYRDRYTQQHGEVW